MANDHWAPPTGPSYRATQSRTTAEGVGTGVGAGVALGAGAGDTVGIGVDVAAGEGLGDAPPLQPPTIVANATAANANVAPSFAISPP